MKKLYLLFTFLVVGFSAKAVSVAEANFARPGYHDAFIFVERGVEFAVFPDGQFDFFFNPRGNFSRIPSHINYSFNAGYDYGPFVQYDDYGAVIQIENVPVYYDYYGRITQAGRVKIRYNAFGMVNRVGNLFVHYDPYHRYTHSSGYINQRNARYIYRPWHDYYSRPFSHFTVVYNEPYRLHYHPNRMKYSAYRNYYKQNYYNKNNFRKSYYRPGERVSSYHRGKRVEEPGNLRRQYTTTRGEVRSTQRTPQQRELRTPGSTQRAEINTRRTRVETPPVQQRAVKQRAEQRRNLRESRSERKAAPNNVRREVQRSSVPATPQRAVQSQSSRTERPATVNPGSTENSPASSRSSRRSRGGN